MTGRGLSTLQDKAEAPAFPRALANEAAPLRVLFCVNWPLDHLSHADSSNFSPNYVVPGEPYWFFKHIHENIHVDVMDCRALLGFDRLERRWVHSYPSKGALASIRSRHYDIVLSHGGQIGLVIGLLQSLFPHLSHTPHVMFDVGAISGGYNGSRNRLISAGCRLAVKSLAGIICHSSKQLDFYRTHYPEVAGRAHFIPLGVDTSEFRPEPSAQQDEIICVGYAKRDWELLIRAYGGLNTATRLVLLGMPSDQHVHQSGVVCVPKVNIAEMRARVSRAKFVVLPLPDSDYCVGQQTFLQSMALGKTVLVPDIPAVRDYITDGETGFLYKVSSEEDLRAKLRTLLATDETLQRIGRAALSSIEIRFRESVMAERILTLLQETATKTASSSHAKPTQLSAAD